MADLLDSILNSMTKPPTLSTQQQREAIKKQKEAAQKKQTEDKEKLTSFRLKIESEINKFIQDEDRHKHKFSPMNKVCRSIVHDIADVAGLTAFSFGEEEVDRHVMVFKKEFAPSDNELAAYRKGEEWDPEKHKADEKASEQDEAVEVNPTFTPNTNYRDKYEKLIGTTSAKDAARITVPNKQFGFVPSENKRDQRSIEQTLADIRAKKKLKTQQTDT